MIKFNLTPRRIFAILGLGSIFLVLMFSVQLAIQYVENIQLNDRSWHQLDTVLSSEYYGDAAKQACGVNPERYHLYGGQGWDDQDWQITSTEDKVVYAEVFTGTIRFNGYGYAYQIKATTDVPQFTLLDRPDLHDTEYYDLFMRSALKQLPEVHYIEVTGSPDVSVIVNSAKVHCNTVYSNWFEAPILGWHE